jgi:pentapeptide MXKDX repeat protein
MKKFIIATALLASMSGVAMAQTTGPAGQQDTNKNGMANPSSSQMNQGGGMNNTTGMSKEGMSKDGMSNNMNRGAESKDGMSKGGMKK